MTTEQQIAALQQRVEKLEERISPPVGKLECGDPEWEIVAYRHVPTSEALKTDIIINQSSHHWQSAVSNVEEEYTIHSIKVKGVVYSVGEEVTAGTYKKYIIQSFHVDKEWIDGMYADIGEAARTSVSNLRHYIVEPILITEDGVKYYDTDHTVYGVVYTTWHTGIRHLSEESYYSSQWKWFSTQEARTEYIKSHKPVLSYNDVVAILDTEMTKDAILYKLYIAELSRVIEQKLK